ncbi:MAG: hypothetical protein KGD57_05520 [Candidatus Lokiarchaeota archaeon]|nr:hypothetical protein [Candidatus Lokiarchaeota archaeon]
MINWIIGGIFLVWIVINRFSRDGNVEDQPLGLPRGTVRALITLIVVSFPFMYLFTKEEIPGLIINAIFILIAFYFETRKSEKEELDRIIKEIKVPEEFIKKEETIRHPLYLPKYSVRILLLFIITLIVVINYYGPQIPFESRNTLFDILIIITLFIIGLIIRGIKNYKKNRNIKETIRNMKNYQNLSDIEIIENIMGLKPSWWQKTGQSILSLFMLTAITSALIFYTIHWDPRAIIFDVSIPIREFLLLLINVYFGFRD